MRRGRMSSTRSAYASMLTILISGVLLLLVVVLGRYAVHAFAMEQAAVLEAQAGQILLSTRDWSRSHGEQLRRTGEIELPLDDLIPPTASGRLTIRYVGAGAEPPLVECNLEIKQSRRNVAWRVYWPVSIRVADSP
jgi:hypothetical protein